jgi:hypothetical protein
MWTLKARQALACPGRCVNSLICSLAVPKRVPDSARRVSAAFRWRLDRSLPHELGSSWNPHE